jgi:hypothetical protein
MLGWLDERYLWMDLPCECHRCQLKQQVKIVSTHAITKKYCITYQHIRQMFLFWREVPRFPTTLFLSNTFSQASHLSTLNFSYSNLTLKFCSFVSTYGCSTYAKVTRKGIRLGKLQNFASLEKTESNLMQETLVGTDNSWCSAKQLFPQSSSKFSCTLITYSGSPNLQIFQWHVNSPVNTPIVVQK